MRMFQHDPLNPDTTTPILFFTRFITLLYPYLFFIGYFSLPVGAEKNNPATIALSSYTWSVAHFFRDCHLNTGVFDKSFYNFLFLQVIWAIGIQYGDPGCNDTAAVEWY